MSCKAAVLIDGGFFHYVAKGMIGVLPQNAHIHQFAHECAKNCTEVFRIFYYNSYPYAKSIINPISRAESNTTGQNKKFIRERTQQFDELAQSALIAFRKGALRFNGWKIKERISEKMIKGQRHLPLNDTDIQMDFQQKSVDIKIGLDVAWLSSRRLVDKMILVTGDTDFVPALKHARREGVQVSVVEFTTRQIAPALKEHSDECLLMDFVNGRFELKQ